MCGARYLVLLRRRQILLCLATFSSDKGNQSRTQPKREWASFYADKRNKTFGSYNEAKAKEITATQKTDLSTEPEDLGRGKRVRRMRRPFSPAIDYHLDSSSCSEEEGASQLMKNGLPPAPFLLPVAQSTALSDEGTPGYYSSLPNEENAVSPTQEICSELISAPITSPQSSSEVEDRSMQIHGQVQRKNSGAAGSTYRKRINESTSGYCSSLPNEENAVSPTQEICSQLISSPITSPQSSNEVEDRSMQIHGQVQRMNSGASGSTYTENVVAGSSGTPACGSSGTMGTFNRYVVSQQDFHILRALKQVNATMKEMDRKILSIDKKVEKTATEETTFADIENFPVSFPLANVEEFIKLEDILNEDPSKAAIVYQLVKSCGGMSESDAICRAWIKITSIECRSDCNWKGVKRGTHQKHGLELSSIKDAVLKGIRMNATYADLKDAVFEHETRKFFVRAPEKVRTKLRAKKRPAGTADHPQLPNGVD